MIDALAAILRLLEDDSALALLVEGRIAAKHKYGLDRDDPNRWAEDAPALVVTYDPGATPDVRAGRAVLRLVALCYGPSQLVCSAVSHALLDILAFDGRRRVLMDDSTAALVYYFSRDSSPLFVFDQDIETDALQMFARTAVAEQDIL